MITPLATARLVPSPCLRSRGFRQIRGFSLVEVVLALGVFSFAMLSMVALIPTGFSAYQTASSKTAMTQITQSVTTQIQLTGIGNITVPSSTNFYFNDQGSQIAPADPTMLYTATVTFSATGRSMPPDNTDAKVLDALSTSAAINAQVYVVSKALPSQTNCLSTIIAY